MIAEQEKREKAIDEIESDICNGCKYYKGKDFCCICDVISYAKTLVGLHYRKEKEVREEILREVINFIKENRYCTIDDELIEEAYKRFGMEVADEK